MSDLANNANFLPQPVKVRPEASNDITQIISRTFCNDLHKESILIGVESSNLSNVEFNCKSVPIKLSQTDELSNYLAAKNDSFLSIGTGSDLCLHGEEEGASNVSESGAGSSTNREEMFTLDDVESGRFTEQESMDLANEFGVNYDEQEADSEQEVIEHLRMELEKAKKELRAKNEKCEKLSEMQNIVDSEIHELTASLFQEAYKMVADANQKRHAAEKLYKEAFNKVDMLEAEVDALKTLVLTSTPSTPNRHLHPQLLANIKKPPLGIFGPRRAVGASTSSALGHKRNHSDTGALCQSSNCSSFPAANAMQNLEIMTEKRLEPKEMDPNYFREFTSWRDTLDPNDKDHAFLKRIYNEEIDPCLNFPNIELAHLVLSSIEQNTVIIERMNEEKPVARTCSLLQMPCVCTYRLKLDNASEWLFISVLCRNRIATVCNFLTYLRYMQQGLVKCGIRDCYWKIIRLRKNMALARLGLEVAD